MLGVDCVNALMAAAIPQNGGNWQISVCTEIPKCNRCIHYRRFQSCRHQCSGSKAYPPIVKAKCA